MLADLEAEIARVKADAKKRHAREQKAEKQIKAVTDAAEKGSGGGGASGTGAGRNTRGSGRKIEDEEDDFDAMEVDGGSGGGMGGGGGKKRSGGGGGAAGLLGKISGRSGR